jgi:rare lipoprotein A
MVFAQTQQGKATYYSKRSTGSRTASGEKLHHDSMTCAHRYYPFGTLLKVTNMSNDKSVVVRVTDRGPFRKGAIVDLSWGAAKEIGMLSSGVQSVKVEVVEDVPTPFLPKDDIFIPTFEIAETEPDFMSEWDENRKETEKQKSVQSAINPKSTLTAKVEEKPKTRSKTKARQKAKTGTTSQINTETAFQFQPLQFKPNTNY